MNFVFNVSTATGWLHQGINAAIAKTATWCTVATRCMEVLLTRQLLWGNTLLTSSTMYQNCPTGCGMSYLIITAACGVLGVIPTWWKGPPSIAKVISSQPPVSIIIVLFLFSSDNNKNHIPKFKISQIFTALKLNIIVK